MRIVFRCKHWEQFIDIPASGERSSYGHPLPEICQNLTGSAGGFWHSQMVDVALALKGRRKPPFLTAYL